MQTCDKGNPNPMTKWATPKSDICRDKQNRDLLLGTTNVATSTFGIVLSARLLSRLAS